MKSMHQHSQEIGQCKLDNKLILSASSIATCATLIELGARTALIHSITCLKETKIREICRELGVDPTQRKGRNVIKSESFTTLHLATEATNFYSVYRRVCRQERFDTVNKIDTDNFITAYQKYTQYLGKKGLFDINRAWYFLQQIEDGIIKEITCSTCQGFHFHIDQKDKEPVHQCVWCLQRRYRHCPDCGFRHHMTDRFPNTTRLCDPCRNIVRRKPTGENSVGGEPGHEKVSYG